MNAPFLIVPPDASDEERAQLAEQARREGRELMPGIPATPARKTIGQWEARTPRCAAGNTAFLANLDRIARGEVRPLTADEAAEGEGNG